MSESLSFDWQSAGEPKALIITPSRSIPNDSYKWPRFWNGLNTGESENSWFTTDDWTAKKIIYQEGTREPRAFVVVNQWRSGEGLHKQINYTCHVEDKDGTLLVTPEAEQLIGESLQGLFNLPVAKNSK